MCYGLVQQGTDRCLQDKFPLHPSHPYRPQKADLDDLVRFQTAQGIAHSCLVAVSVYHTDNSSILDALRRLKGRGRAVVCIDVQTTTDDELRELHDAGARGIRLNLKTRGHRLDKQEFARLLAKSAERIRPYGWAIQLYVSMAQIPLLAQVAPRLGVPVIIDHIAHPEPSNGPAQRQEGYADFMGLLRSGLVWTKLSGTYRFAELPNLDGYVKDILRTAPDRVVWASDWPHSGGPSANPGGNRKAVQEYREVDDRAWIARCKKWCREVEGGKGSVLIRKLWVDNPRVLWQYEDDD